MYSSLSFKVQQLRTKNQAAMLTAIGLLVLALFVSALLPSLLVRYVYANQQLFEQPKLLEYIPTVSFVVGVGYFLIALIGNILREKRAKYLEVQADQEMIDCCSDHASIKEIKTLAESLVAQSKKTKSTAKKKTTRRKAKTKSAKK